MPTGTSTATVSATDGANNTKTDSHQNHVNSQSSQILTFDLNGNMTSDGTNTYKWDAANRLIEIDYPGSGNNTKFAFDCIGDCASIIETVSGSVTSTRQYLWTNGKRREERDASGALSKKFFSSGQVDSGQKYFYFTDYLRSVCEVSDNSGVLQTEYRFDSFGNMSKVLENFVPDFSYAGYFAHARSGLSLAHQRAYNSKIGRWINRDPMGESSGDNLYAYVFQNPLNFIDPSGLDYIPPAPPYHDVETNIIQAEMHQVTKDVQNYWWFYNQVRLGGPWDYKTSHGPWYQNFGNFNFGATAAAACIPLNIARRGAGWANQVSRHGKWGIQQLRSLGFRPYGDDPVDQYWIVRGYNYYTQKKDKVGQCCNPM